MADKAFLTYEEAMAALGYKRSTLYTRIKELDIPTKKFKRDRRSYLAIADVKQLKQLQESPWLGGEDAS